MNSPRLLGIDYGDARIGLAMSDDLGMLAHPLKTVHVRETPRPAQAIAEITRRRGVATVVVGLPLRMDGSEGSAASKVRSFIEELRKHLPPETAIATIDERLSTVAAQEQLHASGRKTRNSRHLIDQAAACVILQDYLDSHQPDPPIDHPD